jgi:predicted nucleotidyltransferase
MDPTSDPSADPTVWPTADRTAEPTADPTSALAARIDRLREACETTPGVTSLVVYGSTTSAAAARRDAWSDLDFTVFLAPAAAADLRRTWAFLPDRDHLVLTAREGTNGGVAVYDDAMIAEFGAGEPWRVQDPHREVLLDGGDLTFGDPDPLPDPADQVGLFLVKLAIGLGRVRRGERVAGNAHLRAYATTCLVEALRQRLAPDAPRSPFDPVRRLEQALPGPAVRLADLLDADAETCARGQLDLARELLEPGWPAFPTRAADVLTARLW